MQSTTTCLLTK